MIQTILYRSVIATPVGEMVALASADGIVLFEFLDGGHIDEALKRVRRSLPKDAVIKDDNDSPLLIQLAAEMAEYFAGTRREFDVPLQPVGTPFQIEVWEALRRIPYGATWSYAEEARSMGRPRAVRAVAQANGRNRMPILIPCHRVIGSDGSLTGYSAGIDRKIALLELERQYLL